MRSLAAEISNHDRRIASDLVLDIQVPGLHIGILEIAVDGLRREVRWCRAAVYACQSGKSLSRRSADWQAKGRIRS